MIDKGELRRLRDETLRLLESHDVITAVYFTYYGKRGIVVSHKLAVGFDSFDQDKMDSTLESLSRDHLCHTDH